MKIRRPKRSNLDRLGLLGCLAGLLFILLFFYFIAVLIVKGQELFSLLEL